MPALSAVAREAAPGPDGVPSLRQDLQQGDGPAEAPGDGAPDARRGGADAGARLAQATGLGGSARVRWSYLLPSLKDVVHSLKARALTSQPSISASQPSIFHLTCMFL